MKTRKELLKSFLESLQLWDLFSAELRKLHEYFGVAEWDCIDNDLRFLFNAISLLTPECGDFRVVSRLKDETYLEQLMNNEDLGSFTFAFAIADLCEYAGLQSEDPRVWHDLPEQVSIMGIVEKVYQVAEV